MVVFLPKKRFLNNKSILVSAILLGLSSRFSVTASDRMSGETCQKNQTSQTMSQYAVVYVTTPNEEVAKKIGHGLVNEKLAACANIIPKIISIYEWEKKINEDSEVLMMIKTRTSKVDNVTEYVKANHPYQVCEVIAVPIINGNQAYMKWIDDVVPEK